MTAEGEVPVEALREGMVLPGRFNGLAAIVWRGARRVDCRRHPRPSQVWPVRIHRDAFAPAQPHRDLLLSPDHAVFVEDVLIPVRHLLNGTTIAQEQRDQVTYWHIELARHDAILAEGLRCESFLDTGNRAAFVGCSLIALHPDFAPGTASAWSERACAPLIEDGPILATARARLARRAPANGGVVEVALRPGNNVVRLSAGRTGACLLSASGRFGADRRRLGALVTGLRLDGTALALDDSRLGLGFHEVEHHGSSAVCWTDGCAMIAVAPAACDQVLEIEVDRIRAQAA